MSTAAGFNGVRDVWPLNFIQNTRISTMKYTNAYVKQRATMAYIYGL